MRSHRNITVYCKCGTRYLAHPREHVTSFTCSRCYTPSVRAPKRLLPRRDDAA